jgi:pimeloyl-ACP methyl ester carboxylesterase
MRFRYLRIFLSFTVLALLSLVLSSIHSMALAVQTPKVAWSPCHKDVGQFECGTVQVPLDYDQPNGATISISVVRLPAGDPSRKIGSLFLNPGGPGGSGVDFALQVAPFLYYPNPDVRARFDIVGFDPRGVARSTALRCFGNDSQWTGLSTNFAFPLTLDEAAELEAADQYLNDACEQRGFKIIDHMSTADVARDLDMLRQAVGDEKLNYAGYSYGTFLGVTYANMFPENVRALVVDGNLDPIAWTTGAPGEQSLPFSTRLRSDEGALDTLHQFFFLCDIFANKCPFAPNSEMRFDTVAARLLAAPLELPQTDGTIFKFRYQHLISLALSAMYSPYSWPSFAEVLQAIEYLSTPVTIQEKLNAFYTNVGFITKRGTPNYLNQVEGFPAVSCSDSDNPGSPNAWWEAAENATNYFGPLWTYASSACPGWPGEKGDRYAGPFNNVTINPVLVVGSTHDPATRYQGSQIVHALLPNSALLTVEGWGHCAFFLSYQADLAVGNYLVDLTIPAEGTVYYSDWIPFLMPVPGASNSVQAARNSIVPITIPDKVRKNLK